MFLDSLNKNASGIWLSNYCHTSLVAGLSLRWFHPAARQNDESGEIILAAYVTFCLKQDKILYDMLLWLKLYNDRPPVSDNFQKGFWCEISKDY
jgi:hypothetical protein